MSLPVYFDSTSRRCGRRSHRLRRRSGSETRACCSHTRTRLLLLKCAETVQRPAADVRTAPRRRQQVARVFLTASGSGLVTGHCSDFPVADPDAVVDHTLS